MKNNPGLHLGMLGVPIKPLKVRLLREESWQRIGDRFFYVSAHRFARGVKFPS